MRELIDASRRSSSYQQAILAALESVRERTGAQRILLLENSSGEEFRTTASVPGTAAVCSLPARGLLMNRLRRYDGPLPLTRADIDTLHRWAVENGSSHLPEITVLNEAEIRLAVPLRTKSEIAGVLLLGPPLSGLDYDQRAIGCCGAVPISSRFCSRTPA